jgi:hypothetical protein
MHASLFIHSLFVDRHARSPIVLQLLQERFHQLTYRLADAVTGEPGMVPKKGAASDGGLCYSAT